MSRPRLLPAGEPFARHSLRIVRALKTGELDPLGYLILKFLVDEIEPPGSGGEAIHKLRELEELLAWPRSGEWLRQKLHALREDGWIDFDEPRRVRDAAWIFRLSGAGIDGEIAPLPSDLQLQTPSHLEVTSNSAMSEEAANPQPESVSESSEPPTAENPREEKRREETRRRARGNENSATRDSSEHEPADWRRLYEELITEGVDKREARVIAHALANDETGEARALLDDDEAPAA